MSTFGCDEREAMDDEWPRGDLEGLALARQVVGALAVDLDRRIDRRRLLDDADEARQRRSDLGRATGRASLAAITLPSASSVSVSSPQCTGEAIGLGPVLDDRHGLGRLAERDRQDAGGERIERAGVSRLLGVEQGT